MASKARELAELIGNAGGTSEQVLSGRRNLIINGDMRISQRGDYSSSTTATHTTYYVDRWAANSSVANTIQHISTNQPAEINGKSTKYTATASGTGIVGGIQHIEDFTKLSNQTVTVSAWVKSNVATAGISVKHDDTWKADTANFHSGSGNWEHLSQTIVINEDLTTRFLVLISLQGTNAASVSISSGDYIEFTGVQLELGSVATPFEHRSYGEELALCQRYYQHFVQMKANELHWTGTGGYYGGPVFPLVTTMRANPSIAKVANGTYSTSIGSTTQSSHQNMTVSATQDYASFHNNVTGSTIYGCQIAVRLDAEL